MNLLLTMLMQVAVLALVGAGMAHVVGAHGVRARLVQATVTLVALAAILGPVVSFVRDRLRGLETAARSALGGGAPDGTLDGTIITTMGLAMGAGHLALWVWWRRRQRPPTSDSTQLREPRRHRPGEPGGGR